MMGSLKIGSWFGIPVRLHWSMLLLPLLTQSFFGQFGLVWWMVFEVLLFTSVVVHEFGHALVARRYGVRTYDIVLTPLGGMARMVDMPTTARPEIAIAVAGPLASLALSSLAFGGSIVAGILPVFGAIPVALLSLIWEINLGLGLFNLVPALPMDGGRVLRGLLTLKFDHLTATRKAATVGKLIAVAGAVFGLWNSMTMLVVIAVFIYLAAGSEVRMAQWREAQRAQAEGLGTGPFTYRPRVWTWPRPPHGGAGPSAPEPGPDWQTPQAPSRNVILVEGGKAEILGRDDPKK